MSWPVISVGVWKNGTHPNTVDLCVSDTVPPKRYLLSSHEARNLARRLYWAARMVDRLNATTPRPTEPGEEK